MYRGKYAQIIAVLRISRIKNERPQRYLRCRKFGFGYSVFKNNYRGINAVVSGRYLSMYRLISNTEFSCQGFIDFELLF